MNSSFPGGIVGKESTVAQCRRHKKCQFSPRVGKISWRRARQPTPVFLPRESHGQRSLAGYIPWGCKESDTTEHARMCECSVWTLYSTPLYIYIWIYNLMPVLWSQESQEGWVAQICFFFSRLLCLLCQSNRQSNFHMTFRISIFAWLLQSVGQFPPKWWKVYCFGLHWLHRSFEGDYWHLNHVKSSNPWMSIYFHLFRS